MILGIESSCDDSSIALIDEKTLKLEFYKKISQELEHSKFGGVVPELAARLHTAALPNLINDIKPYLKEISAVCVTNTPGLSVSLIGGVSMAKTISMMLDIPLIGVNHLIGHIYSLFIEKLATFPIGVLLVSGGHTLVLDVKDDKNIIILATTTDDSFGESFDKVAKMMDLGYPGGSIIEEKSKNGDAKKFNFTVPLKYDNRIEYSFSGLKNQVRLTIENAKKTNTFDEQLICDISASFQKTACEHIINKLTKIFNEHKFKNFGVVGGASANLYLRKNIEKLCEKHNSTLFLAPMKFCSDNGAMIARVGVESFKRKEFISYKDIEIIPNSNLKNIKKLDSKN